MKKYKDFQDTGVEWIGAVPINWERRKFNWDVFYQEGPGLRSFQFSDDGIRVICVSNITDIGIDFTTTHTRHISNEEYLSKYLHFTVEDKDIMLSSSGSIGKVARYYFDGEPVILNTSTIRLHSKNKSKVIDDFIPYLLSSSYVQLQLRFLMTGGIVSNFGPSHLDQIFNYLPPLSEQHAIVSFLDDKTSQIDALISNSEKKIELLKEKRTALINHVVTKGLDPNVKMKDSGVEWIGEIPENWIYKSLKHFVNPFRKITYGIVQPGTGDPNGRYMIRGQDYSKGWANPETVFRVSDDVEVPYQRARLASGDIVFTIVGAGVGNCAVVPAHFDGANITQTTARISPNDNVDGKYLYYALRSSQCIEQLGFSIRGAAQPGLTLTDLSNFIFATPSIKEQKEIVKYLDHHTSEIDKEVSLEQRRIELLKEYRQSLISEVVTGKINVLDYAS